MFRVFPEALDPCFACFTLSRSSLCNAYHRPCHLCDVKKIHGSLCHIAFVYLNGHSHLPSLSNFASTFHSDEFPMKYPPHSLITDLKWWLVKLSLWGIHRSLWPLGPLSDLGLYVDASTSWGIGIIIGAEWAAFQLSPSWKTEGQDICWLETVAIELLQGGTGNRMPDRYPVS